MREGEPNLFETYPEHIPTTQEVQEVFKELTKKPFVETRRVEDEKGLLILEVEVVGDSESEVIEYAYRRTLTYLEGRKTEVNVPEIHISYYKSGGVISGTSAARYVNGQWIVI